MADVVKVHITKGNGCPECGSKEPHTHTVEEWDALYEAYKEKQKK